MKEAVALCKDMHGILTYCEAPAVRKADLAEER